MQARDITQIIVSIRAVRIDSASQALHKAREAATAEGFTVSETEDRIEACLIQALGELAQAQHEIHSLIAKLGG